MGTLKICYRCLNLLIGDCVARYQRVGCVLRGSSVPTPASKLPSNSATGAEQPTSADEMTTASFMLVPTIALRNGRF